MARTATTAAVLGNTATVSTDVENQLRNSPIGLVEVNGRWFVKYNDTDVRTYDSRESAEQAWGDHNAVRGGPIAAAIGRVRRFIVGGPDNAMAILTGDIVRLIAKGRSGGSNRGRGRGATDPQMQIDQNKKHVLSVDEKDADDVRAQLLQFVQDLRALNDAPDVPIASIKNPYGGQISITPQVLLGHVQQRMLPTSKAVDNAIGTQVFNAAFAALEGTEAK
jgi:hypothetical protein